MTEGTQPQEQLEKIPESKDLSNARVELDQATHKSEETVELKMEVPAAEKVQEEFTALVDNVPENPRIEAVDSIEADTPSEKNSEVSLSGKQPEGSQAAAPAQSYADLRQGQSDLNNAQAAQVRAQGAAGETDTTADIIPEEDATSAKQEAEKGSDDSDIGFAAAPPDINSESEVVSPSAPPAEGSDSGLTSTASSAQYNPDTASVNMQAAADLVASASDKLSGMDMALNAANEKLEAAEEALAENREIKQKDEAVTKPDQKKSSSDYSSSIDNITAESASEVESTTKNISNTPENQKMTEEEKQAYKDTLAESADLHRVVSNLVETVKENTSTVQEEGHTAGTFDGTEDATGKAGFGEPATRASAHYGSVDMSQGAVAQDSDWNQAAGGSSPVGTGPEDAIPEGESFEAGGAADLKKLLAPFKNNLGALREMVAASQVKVGQEETTYKVTPSKSGAIDFNLISSVSRISDQAGIDPQTLAQNSMQNSYADASQDLGDYAEKKASTNEAKAGIREESSMLQDELSDWPDDGSTKEITYYEFQQNEDGSWTKVEKTETLTKEEAKALLSKLEALSSTLRDQSETDGISDQNLAEIQILESGSILVEVVADIKAEIEDNIIETFSEDPNASQEGLSTVAELIEEARFLETEISRLENIIEEMLPAVGQEITYTTFVQTGEHSFESQVVTTTVTQEGLSEIILKLQEVRLSILSAAKSTENAFLDAESSSSAQSAKSQDLQATSTALSGKGEPKQTSDNNIGLKVSSKDQSD